MNNGQPSNCQLAGGPWLKMTADAHRLEASVLRPTRLSPLGIISIDRIEWRNLQCLPPLLVLTYRFQRTEFKHFERIVLLPGCKGSQPVNVALPRFGNSMCLPLQFFQERVPTIVLPTKGMILAGHDRCEASYPANRADWLAI